ncbi:MAG: uroporphyrinogen-III synthase, partial [Bosea sp. (in: a-proteobacteria)]
MRVLVLRPEEQGHETAKALKRLGHDAVMAPLFVLRATREKLPEGPFAAVVVNSGNAVPRLASVFEAAGRSLPVLAVGDRTAALARESGFADARSASGDRRDLVELIAQALPKGAHLLLATGEHRHADLPDWLREAGYTVSEWAAYRAEAASELPKAAREALSPQAGKPVEVVLHYSPRGAETFLRLCDAAGLSNAAREVTHVCLSQEVAQPLRAAGARSVHLAAKPNEASLFSALGLLQARNAPVVDARKVDENVKPSLSDPPMSKKSRSSLAGPATAVSAAAATATSDALVSAEAATPVNDATANEQIDLAAPKTTPEMPTETVAPPAPEAIQAAVTPAKSGFGGLALLLAGLCGGLTGAGAMLYAPRLLPASVALPDPSSALSARIDAMQKQILTRD